MPGTIEMAEASLSMADVDIQTAAAARKTMSTRAFWNSLSYALAGAASTYCCGISVAVVVAIVSIARANVSLIHIIANNSCHGYSSHGLEWKYFGIRSNVLFTATFVFGFSPAIQTQSSRK